jgi:hypothetical protein
MANRGPKALRDLLTLPRKKQRVVAIEIVSTEDGQVVKTIDVDGRTPSQIEKIDAGMQINLDHARFFTRMRND